MKIRDLSKRNPWWKDKDWRARSKDIDLQRRRKSQVSWVPRLMYFFNLKEDAIYTMRGPRQVGKTTLIKIMIRELLEKKVHPKRIFFGHAI
jgi:hypothetical protein